jgi:Zn-dependent membrane protease YugP
MTGAQFARNHLGCHKVRETLVGDCYDPKSRIVYLSYGTFHGIDTGSIYRAAHEVAHALQHEEMPRRFSLNWMWPVRLWLERDAWDRATVMMRTCVEADPVTLEGIRKKNLGTYEARARLV